MLSHLVSDTNRCKPIDFRKYNFKDVPLDDELVWNLYKTGNVKGLFQVESPLGKQWCKKIKPDNIDDLAALQSLIRPGALECISGESKILVGFNNIDSNKYKINTKSIKIKDLYEQFVNFNKWKHRGDKKLTLVSVDEKTNKLIKNKIISINKNGIKTTYKVNIDLCLTGRKQRKLRKKLYLPLYATLGHKFLTLDGWKELGQIAIGEYIAIFNKNFDKIFKDNKNCSGQHTFKEICFRSHKYKCLFCDWSEGSLDVNHIHGNRYTNNDKDNLCFLCPNHHRMYSEGSIYSVELYMFNEQNKLPNTKDIRYVRYNGCEVYKEEDVYDISVEGPNHNYIANDIIVHNCGMTEKFAKIKSGEEQPEYLHESLRSILSKTRGVLCFQEQILEISSKLAGFTEVEADLARKAIGKKDPEEMMRVKILFINGCEKTGIINKEIAEEIFGWIQKSVRYIFNASHSYSYSYISYFQAWQKQYLPLEFYTAALTYSSEKIDPKIEIQELVQDARINNVIVLPPRINELNDDFKIGEDNKILFGLSHIRGVGQSAINKLLSVKNLKTFNDFILGVHKIGRGVSESLIKSGACDDYKISRSQMLRIIHIIFGRGDEQKTPEFSKLTPNEYKTFAKNIDLGFTESLKKIIDEESCIKKREPTILKKIELIQEKLDDTNRSKSVWEKLYLGINLTCSAADDIEVTDPDTKSCKEVTKLKDKSKATIHVVIDNINERLTSAKAKTPNVPYCIMSVSDNSGCLQLMCWPDVYQFIKEQIAEDMVCSIKLAKNNWGGRDQIVIKDLTVIG